MPFETLHEDAGVHLCKYLTNKDYRSLAQASRAAAALLLATTRDVCVRRRLTFSTRLQLWSRTRYTVGRGVQLSRDLVLGGSGLLRNMCESGGVRTRRRVFDSTLCEQCTCRPRLCCFMVRRDVVMRAAARLCDYGEVKCEHAQALRTHVRYTSTRQGCVCFLHDAASLLSTSPARLLFIINRL